MKYAMLSMLLALMQALPPVPRQAATSSAGTSGHIQSQTNANKTPPAQSPPSVNANAAPSHDVNRSEQGTDNSQHSISVSKLPTVTVSSPKRDWADWGYWAFNLLLVVVGIFQVILLVFTWKTIQRQVQLQEFNQQQWMDIGDWEVEEDKESSDPLIIDLSFNLFNTTPIPITLRRVETTIGRFPIKPLRRRGIKGIKGIEETFVVTENLLLPPPGSKHRSSYSCLVPIVVPNAALASYRTDGLWLSIRVQVFFLAADGKEKPQWFHQLAVCRPNKIELWMPKGAIPEKKEKDETEAN
jgi:hypothetical protein